MRRFKVKELELKEFPGNFLQASICNFKVAYVIGGCVTVPLLNLKIKIRQPNELSLMTAV